jgi:chromosome segregation ATPase
MSPRVDTIGELKEFFAAYNAAVNGEFDGRLKDLADATAKSQALLDSLAPYASVDAYKESVAADIAVKETDIEAKAEAVAKREEDATAREADIASREATLKGLQDGLANDLATLETKKQLADEVATKAQADLDAEVQGLADRATALDARDAAITAHEVAIAQKLALLSSIT